MTVEKNIFLTSQQIQQKTKRIAYQILESNSKEKEIVLAGITSNGYLFAKEIEKELTNISDISITMCEVSIDKKKPLNPIKTSITSDEYKNKPLVLVDDVLNSGATLNKQQLYFL